MLKKLSLALLAVLLVGSFTITSCGEEPTSEDPVVFVLSEWLANNDSMGTPFVQSGGATIKFDKSGITISGRSVDYDAIDFNVNSFGLNYAKNSYIMIVEGYIPGFAPADATMRLQRASSPWTTLVTTSVQGFNAKFEINYKLDAAPPSNIRITSHDNQPVNFTYVITEILILADTPVVPPVPPVPQEGDWSFDVDMVAATAATINGAVGPTATTAQDGSSVKFTFAANNAVGVIALTSDQKAKIQNGDTFYVEIKGTVNNDNAKFRFGLGNPVDHGSNWNATGLVGPASFDDGVLAGNATGNANFAVADYFLIQIRDDSGPAELIIDSVTVSVSSAVPQFILTDYLANNSGLSSPLSRVGTPFVRVGNGAIELTNRTVATDGLQIAVGSSGIGLNLRNRKYSVKITGNNLSGSVGNMQLLKTDGTVDGTAVIESTSTYGRGNSFVLSTTIGLDGAASVDQKTTALRINNSNATASLLITGIEIAWIYTDVEPPPTEPLIITNIASVTTLTQNNVSGADGDVVTLDSAKLTVTLPAGAHGDGGRDVAVRLNLNIDTLNPDWRTDYATLKVTYNATVRAEGDTLEMTVKSGTGWSSSDISGSPYYAIEAGTGKTFEFVTSRFGGTGGFQLAVNTWNEDDFPMDFDFTVTKIELLPAE
jgi:hypothetical protein